MTFVNEETEKQELSELNLMAGDKALLSNAYDSALNYLKIAVNLIGKNSWKNNYDFTLDLYTKTTVAAQLNADYEIMETHFDETIQNAVNILHTIKVYETKIFAHIAQKKPKEAIKIGLYIIRKLGGKFPGNPGKLRIIREILLIKFALIGKNIEDVTNMTLTFNNGGIALIQSSWLDPNKVREMTFVGKKRMLVYDDTASLEKIKI